MDDFQEAVKTEPVPPSCQRAVSLAEIREEITTLVKSNAVGMVQKTIDQVNKGHRHEVFV